MVAGSLEVLSASGEGSVLYPSGRVAATVCRGDDGCFHTFSSDAARARVLATFDADGVGSVNRPGDGRPWLVVTRRGWSLSNEAGGLERGGAWPRANADRDPIVLQPSPELEVTFLDRQRIAARLRLPGVDRTFECGEASRRCGEGSHLDKVLRVAPGGKLELDTAAIRKRAAAVGSVYVAPGPHRRATARPGLGNLRAMLAAVGAASPVRPLVAELDGAQQRLRRVAAARRAGLASAPAGGSTGSGSGSAAGGSGDSSGASQLDDFGAPPLTASQRQLSARLQRATASARPAAAAAAAEGGSAAGGADAGYVCRRQRLPLLTVAQLHARVAGAGAPKGVLFAVALLSDYDPICARLEKKHLEAAAFELAAEAAGEGGSSGKDAVGGGGGGSECIRLIKVSGAESPALQRRFGFRAVPFFLFFYEGRLVDATNDVRSAVAARERCAAALAAGRRGNALPEGVRLGGLGDRVLEGITPHMSLLRRG